MLHFVTMVQFSPKMLRNESGSTYVYVDIQETYCINTDAHKAIQLPFYVYKNVVCRSIFFYNKSEIYLIALGPMTAQKVFYYNEQHSAATWQAKNDFSVFSLFPVPSF